MDRSHWELRRALVAAMESLAATHWVAAKLCSAKKLLLAMEPVRWASERARIAEMLSAAPGSSLAEPAAFVQAFHTQPPVQLPTRMKPSTNL